jgi:FKBP-type peptidyl-prolyl cis-trans isomerase 2
MSTLRATFLLGGLLLAGVADGQPPPPSKTAPEVRAAEAGSEVALQYVLRDDTGKVIHSNQGEVPLRFTVGTAQIIRGLHAAVTGMRAGESKRFTLQPAEAYGPVDPTAVAEIARERLPAEALREGTYVMAQTSGGPARLVRVQEVRERTVVIDLNHPLAGKVLHFEVEVLEVLPPRN